MLISQDLIADLFLQAKMGGRDFHRALIVAVGNGSEVEAAKASACPFS